MEFVPAAYQPVWEARQEAENGSRSVGSKNSDKYLKEYGVPYTGQFQGELEAAELNLN